jgi:hypothetical protein
MTTITATLTMPSKPRKPAPTGRIPRVARLMALAIKLDGMLRDGVVGSQAELAELGGVTRARLTQVLNLTALAPDLQEILLHLPPVLKGRDPVSEHDLRPIAAEIRWTRQRALWEQALRDACLNS